MKVISKTGIQSGSLAQAKRIIIKIGSSLLIDDARGELRRPWLMALIEDIAALQAAGKDVVLVSSGSVALGRRLLGLGRGKIYRLEQTQACAACGQVHLMQAYQQILEMHGLGAAQILLTMANTENRQAYLSVRATLLSLLSFGTIPIINENDTVARPTRRYGDNDRLAARVAAMIGADCLVLLSDIDGLYSADPSVDPQARFIPEIEDLTPDIIAMGGGSRSGLGQGGMRTKIEAAQIALSAGCAMVIAQGKDLHPLRALMDGGKSSWFLPNVSPAAARKLWISGGLDTRGNLVIDDGAYRALQQGRSLLPVGVKQVGGTFMRGDLVRILRQDGQEVARGLVAYASDEVSKIMGRHSDAFSALLGYRGQEEIVHRDDLALLGGTHT
ncbi:MAG: glutamate 5-kinase [Bdellovibrionales bacterium]